MKPTSDRIESALTAGSRSEMRAALGNPPPPLQLSEIARLTARLRSLDECRIPLKLAILRTYSTELLAPHWTFESLLCGFDLDLYLGPYGLVMQEASADTGLVRHDPDLTLVFITPHDLGPAFGGPLSLLSAGDRKALVDCGAEHAHMMLAAVRQAVPGAIVVTLLPPAGEPELGHYDAMAEDSEAVVRFELKRAIAQRIRSSLPDVLLHDLDDTVVRVGRDRFFDSRLWHSSRFPFSTVGSQYVVRDLMTYATRISLPPAKCIVLDADNTLWGGIVGEDGPQGIAIGPHYPGSCFVEFQRRLLEFRQRGILLAMCSKNNEADVLEVLRSHPHQLLKEEHFAALRINWEPKPSNLHHLARELNLGVDSFVFVDDSPYECHAVKMGVPGVTVVQAPDDPLAMPTCLDHESRLEILSLTPEDRRRSAMYGEERRRRKLEDEATSVEEYLRSLQMHMTVRINDLAHLDRLTQLTQKTNQFNLTTRRHSEAEMEAFMTSPGSFVQSFSLSDRFGDSGIVGVAVVQRIDEEMAAIETFLMSCRIIGRGAETSFLRSVLESCARHGYRRVMASYLPTPKNGQVADFWANHGFQEIDSGKFEMALDRLHALGPMPPIEVSVEDHSLQTQPE